MGRAASTRGKRLTILCLGTGIHTAFPQNPLEIGFENLKSILLSNGFSAAAPESQAKRIVLEEALEGPREPFDALYEEQRRRREEERYG